MEQVNYKKFYPTAIALYFTYFIHGIGASILPLHPDVSGIDLSSHGLPYPE